MKATQAKSESAYERLLMEIARMKEASASGMAQLKAQFKAESAQIETQMARRESRMMIWVAIVVGVAFAAERFSSRDVFPLATQSPPVAQAPATPGQTPQTPGAQTLPQAQ